MIYKIQIRTGVLLTIIISISLVRIVNASGQHALANFSPIGAMALFAGNYFSERWKAYLFPLLTLWISDLVICNTIYYQEWHWFYGGFYWTYISFILMVVIGSFIRKVTIKSIMISAVLAALTHYLISDFGVWIGGTLYPKTFEGFIACYLAAIPFLKNMLLGNILFSFLIFGAFEWICKHYPGIKLLDAK
jgi:hypothetical protein